jgi:hypothetical protein
MPETLVAPVVSNINPRQEEWFNKSEPLWFGKDGELNVPKDYKENLRYRIWLRGLEVPGVDDNHLIKASLLNRCKRDILFFFNTFLWTQDPRKRPADLPFITYQYEDTYINWVQEHINGKKDCFTEKSRDMGISWCLMGIAIYNWLFIDGFKGHLGSKKEDDVDRSEDIRSLFEKLRYLLGEIPPWLLPYGFDWKKHSMYMRILNPYNSSAITGESSNRDFGRAGRYSMCFMDEFAAMEYADEAWTATGDSTPCRIVCGTPMGSGNKFWQLRFKSSIDIFTAHWTLHPEKSKDTIRLRDKVKLSQLEAFDNWKKGEKISSSWYEAEKNRRLTSETQSKVDIAQELDIDYVASGNPYFDVDALKKQIDSEPTEDWLRFCEGAKHKVIVGTLTLIDGQIEFRPNKNGWLRLFEVPSKGGQYVGGLDAAEGLEHGDYSSGSFRCKKTRNLVAGIYGHFDYDELAYYGYLTARYFNNALVCAEAGGYGAAVNKRMYDLGANVARATEFSSGSLDEKDKLGWMNTVASRPKALGDLEAEIREQACELRDKDLKNECFNFINKDGKPQASEGSNDDYVWSFAIAGQLMRFRPYSVEIEKAQRFKDKVKQMMPKANMGFSFKRSK